MFDSFEDEDEFLGDFNHALGGAAGIRHVVQYCSTTTLPSTLFYVEYM
jgi:hypothetical protein